MNRAVIFYAICFCLKAQADIVFTWSDATNHPAGAETTIWQGSSNPLNYSTPYSTTNISLTFYSANLHDGANYFACQQIITNKLGQPQTTRLSGEIQVRVNPAMAVDTRVMATSDLGRSWTQVGEGQTMIFPETNQMEFVKTEQRARRTNIVVLPPPMP